MKLRSLVSIIVVAFLFLTGCQWGNNDTNRDGRIPVDETRNTRDGQMTNDRLTQNVENKNRFQTNNRRDTNREHDRFEVSGEAAERIVEEVEEIGQAYVLTSKKNAYVAATLRENDRSPGDRSNENTRERRGTLNDGDNSTGDNRGMMTHDNRGTKNNGKNRGTKNDNNNRTGMNDNARTNDGTNNATNFRDMDQNVQNRNSRGDEISEDVKKRISDIVKDTDKNIDNVYVSTSPDFFDLTNDFADDVENGHPVEGFFDQIGNMIERVFPQNQR